MANVNKVKISVNFKFISSSIYRNKKWLLLIISYFYLVKTAFREGICAVYQQQTAVSSYLAFISSAQVDHTNAIKPHMIKCLIRVYYRIVNNQKHQNLYGRIQKCTIHLQLLHLILL